MNLRPARLLRLILLAAGLAAGTAVHAHKASDAYLRFEVAGADVDARIDIALRDLDRDLDLDANADDQLSWKEVRVRWADMLALARRDIRLSADGAPCQPDPASTPVTDASAPALTPHSDGRYAVLRMHWHCAARVQQLSVDYRLFAHTDPTHRGLVYVLRRDEAAPASASESAQGRDEPVAGGEKTGGGPALAVLSPGAGWHRFKLPPPAPIAPAASSLASATPAGVDSAVPVATAGASSARAGSGTWAGAGAGAGAARSAASALPPTRAPAAATNDAADTGADTTASEAEAPSAFGGFVREGVHHILIGYDHILFLLSLLLPAVWLRQRVRDPRSGRERTRWVPAPDWRPALTSVLKVVTAFTVAHSITLALAVFEIVDPPSRWIESTIAASVVLAALNNLWPVISEARWKLTFVFGLVHGFGFASALKDAGLAHGALVGPLVGFNLGVELGQLCIVAAVLPLAWAWRGTRGYRGAFAGGSLAIATVAGLWLVQRAFDLSLIAG